MATEFTVAGLTFNGDADEDGTLWVAEIPSGWEAAEAATKTLDKTGDGAVLVGRRLAARSLIINGHVVATSNDTMWTARNALEAAVESLAAADGTLTVSEPDGDKSLAVAYVGRLKVDQRTAVWFRFQLPLVAADPAKTPVGS